MKVDRLFVEIENLRTPVRRHDIHQQYGHLGFSRIYVPAR